VDGDPVKLLALKRSTNGTVILKVTLRGNVGTQPLGIVPPNAGSDGGLILDVSGGDRYCVLLGGAAGGVHKQNSARRWRVVNATAKAGCPSPPPPVCGNGVVESGEQCDGSNLGDCFMTGASDCFPSGAPNECHCCVRGSYLAPPSSPPPCCVGSPTYVGLNTWVCDECGGGYPVCGGDGCGATESCSAIVYAPPPPAPSAASCGCFATGVACEDGGAACPSGSVCVVQPGGARSCQPLS
jgi:hypothetical protein